MARYRKIYRGPSHMPTPQVRELPAAADTLPGTLVVPEGGSFTAATSANGQRRYIAQDNYLAIRSTDDWIPQGDVLLGLELMDDRVYAARLAAGQSVSVGDALSCNASGMLVAAAAGSLVIAYANETFNNTNDSSELIDVRFGQSYVA